MSEWIDAEKELPKQSAVIKVKLDNGDETKAYFYKDKMHWVEYYGKKTSYWWHKETKEPLFNVTHWEKESK